MRNHLTLNITLNIGKYNLCSTLRIHNLNIRGLGEHKIARIPVHLIQQKIVSLEKTIAKMGTYVLKMQS